MELIRYFLFTLILLGFCACATPTPYAPAGKKDTGYRDQKIEETRYRVSFKGNEVTNRETVELYLLYRSAEITLENKYDYFIIAEKDTESDVRLDTVGPGAYGMYGFGRRRFGTGLGVSWNQTVQTNTKYEALVYITLFKGSPPKDNPRAYDAREVIKNIGPRIVRPEKK